jgi:hypothetical protein
MPSLAQQLIGRFGWRATNAAAFLRDKSQDPLRLINCTPS